MGARLMVVDDGDTVRVDGFARGALLINKRGKGYRLRVTRQEGGEFVIDYVCAPGSDAHRLARAIFWRVRQGTSDVAAFLSRKAA